MQEIRRRLALIIRDLSVLYGDLIDREFHTTTEEGERMTAKKKGAAKPKGPVGKKVKN